MKTLQESQLRSLALIPSSIIFVHGLFGDPQGTWTGSDSTNKSAHAPSGNHGQPGETNAARVTATPKRMLSRFWRRANDHEMAIDIASQQVSTGSGVFWPKELLPRATPQTRIYTWGYDVDINHVFSNASQATVFQHAGTLLSDIANTRNLISEVCKLVARGISQFEAVSCPQY